MAPFRKVLIANRGEIAVRVARTLREMGIGSVGVYSEADAGAPHTQAVDEAHLIGPAAPMQSYLNQDRILEVARASGAEAVHSGYGFLSENAGFAERCRDAGLVFVGPTPEAIRSMGSKVAARQAAKAAGVPIVPGTEQPLADADEIRVVAEGLGYPVAIKASAGGGGYGMRVARSAEEVAATLEGVRRDAERAFGDTTVYVEKFFSPAPRHVEVQVLGDRHGNVVHLGERECSLQRRFQKIVEETPSPAVSPELRARMGTAAVALAKAIGYTSAGTVECLVDDRGEFYFLEMNTRLQVEHPVTEQVTGVDLVREMLRVAMGEPLSVPAEGVAPRGHAIEARVYAEDPARNFMPQPGKISRWEPAGGPGVRMDTHVVSGYEVPKFYDSMVGKLIVHDDDRDLCINRSLRALREFRVEPIKTTIPLHQRVLEHSDFKRGGVDIHWLERLLKA